jgi:rRNA-processing protein FCF1
MTEEIQRVVEQTRRAGLLIDTNILLLLLAGRFDRRLIGNFKRLAQFNDSDFDVLQALVSRYQRLLTTPNILTEVSSFANQLPEVTRAAFFGNLADELVLLDERYVASRETAPGEDLRRLGLADAVTAVCAREGILVLTDDFRLAQTLRKRGLHVLNFNHLRTLYWN